MERGFGKRGIPGATYASESEIVGVDSQPFGYQFNDFLW
jgi:hypothetical protein